MKNLLEFGPNINEVMVISMSEYDLHWISAVIDPDDFTEYVNKFRTSVVEKLNKDKFNVERYIKYEENDIVTKIQNGDVSMMYNIPEYTVSGTDRIFPESNSAYSFYFETIKYGELNIKLD